jgi:putative ABC transport system permease protein
MINNPAIMIYMENIDDKVNVSVLYNEPKEYIEINKNICANIGLNEEIDTYVNSQLLRFQGVMSENMLNMLYTIAGIIIIIIVVSSIFVIRNCFSISVSEKNRQYGMQASIGATSKQIKKNVIFEGNRKH